MTPDYEEYGSMHQDYELCRKMRLMQDMLTTMPSLEMDLVGSSDLVDLLNNSKKVAWNGTLTTEYIILEHMVTKILIVSILKWLRNPPSEEHSRSLATVLKQYAAVRNASKEAKNQFGSDITPDQDGTPS